VIKAAAYTADTLNKVSPGRDLSSASLVLG